MPTRLISQHFSDSFADVATGDWPNRSRCVLVLGMGYRPLRTLADIARAKDMCVEVTCGECGRVAIYHAAAFMLFQGRLSRLSLAEASRRFRCTPPTGCGARAAQLRPTFWPPISPVPAARQLSNPQPLAVYVPPGVDPDAWKRATPRDRKAMIRRARG